MSVADNIYPHSKEGQPQTSSQDGHFSVEQVFDKGYNWRMVLYSNRVNQLPHNIPCPGFRIQNTHSTGKVFWGTIFAPPYVNQTYQGDNRGTIIYPGSTDPINLTNTNLCIVTTDVDGTEINVMVYGNTEETLEDTFESPAQFSPPTISSTNPTNGATNVSTTATIFAIFSEGIDAEYINDAAVTRSPGFTATISLDANDNTKLIIDPTSSLSTATLYTITIKRTIRDLNNDPMAADHVFTFTTAAAPDTTPPTVVSRSPTNGSTNVSIGVSPTITFSEEMSAASINNTNCRVIRTSDSANQAAAVSLSADKKTVTINPNSNLAASTGFTLRATTGVEDIALNNLASQSDSTFTTQAVDTTPPTITNKSPAAGSTNHSISGNITITFSENIDGSTVNSSTVSLKKGSTVISSAISETGGVITINPNSNLEYSTVYTVTIVGGGSGVKDDAGNAFASTTSWTFTTQAPTYTLIYNIAQSAGAWNRLEDTEQATGLKITSSQSSGSGYPLWGKKPKRCRVKLRRNGNPSGNCSIRILDEGDENNSHEINFMPMSSITTSGSGSTYEFTNPTMNFTLDMNDVIVVWTDNGDDSNYIEVARTNGDDWAFGHRIDYLRGATNDTLGQEDTDWACELYS